MLSSDVMREVVGGSLPPGGAVRLRARAIPLIPIDPLIEQLRSAVQGVQQVTDRSVGSSRPDSPDAVCRLVNHRIVLAEPAVSELGRVFITSQHWVCHMASRVACSSTHPES